MTFDIDQFNVIIAGAAPSDLGDGEVYKFTSDGDDWNFLTGADGVTSRSKTNIKSGMFDIVLKRTSPDNTRFSGLRITDLTTPGGEPFTVLVKDNAGSTVLQSDECCFVGVPEAGESSTEVSTRTWQVKMMNIDINQMIIGGNE